LHREGNEVMDKGKSFWPQKVIWILF
jgi:hypothetical protein